MATRRKFSQEYKHEAVRLPVSSNQPVSRIARDLGISPNMLSHWCREAKAEDRSAFPAAGEPRDEKNTHIKRELARKREAAVMTSAPWREASSYAYHLREGGLMMAALQSISHILVATSLSVWHFLGDNWRSIVATAVLCVAVYQTRATRIHNRLSAKPHLAFFLTTNLDRNSRRFDVTLHLENNGLGPAYIKVFQVLLEGKEIESLSTGIEKLFTETGGIKADYKVLHKGHMHLTDN